MMTKRSHFVVTAVFILIFLQLFSSSEVDGKGYSEFSAEASSGMNGNGCSIKKQPEDCQCAAGDIALFRVETDGKVLGFQWQVSKDGGNTWGISDLSGNKTATLSLQATESRNNYQFRCTVYGENNVTITSDTVTLTVRNDIAAVNRMNLLETSSGKNDMMWSYQLSMNPIVISFKGIHDRIYWGYTSKDGYSGIASYDFDTGEVLKTHLKRSEVDDHNNTSVFEKDGHIIASYSEGHNEGNTMNYRISSEPESLDRFQDVFQYTSDVITCYGQFFEYNDVIFSFFRYNNNSWHCLSSSDGGYTWGDEKKIIEAPFQYYCKFQETTVPGLLRLCMYSNPSGEDPSIRMGFLDLNTGLIYNSDRQTVLGNWDVGIYYVRFDQIIIPRLTQRLFDVAVTEPEDPSILVGQYPDKQNDTAIYYWYNSGELKYICDAGESLLHYSYLNGMAFYGTDRVVLSRSDKLDVPNGKDYIEIWRLGNNPALEKTIYSEEKQSIPIRRRYSG